MVDSSGFEPEASALRRQRSSELIYEPTRKTVKSNAFKCFSHAAIFFEFFMYLDVNIHGMISPTMYELLKVRFFDAPPSEASSVANVLNGHSDSSIRTVDGDTLMFEASGTASFNGIPIGTIHKLSYDIPLLSIEIQGDVQGMQPSQPLKWRVRF